MAGRPANKSFKELGFALCKFQNKYVAVCNICKKGLKNTAAARLKGHRNVCKTNKADILWPDNERPNENKYASDLPANISAENSVMPKLEINIENNDDPFTEADVGFMDVSYASDISPQALATAPPSSTLNVHNFLLPQTPESASIFTSSSRSGSTSYLSNPYETSGSDNIKKSKITTKKNVKITNYMDKITPTEEAELNSMLANLVFGCNLPLRVVESKHFKNFVEKLRPAYASRLPNRKLLSTTLLDTAHENCITKNKNKFGLDSVLLIDGWKNTSSNAKTVICMLHTSNGEHSFLHAWDLYGERESSEKLADIITEAKDMAKTQFDTNVYAVVSDNTSSMMQMGKLVSHSTWHITCNSHTGNLLAKDLINKDLNEKVVAILKEFKQVDFENFIVNKGGHRIKLPSETRWCSSRDSYICLIQNLNHMKRLAADLPKKKVKQNVIKLIFDDEFIEEVKEFISVFDPICHLITKCQSLEFSVADAVHLWLNLSLPDRFQNNFKSKIESRRNMALNIYALTAYYLHPTYDNKKLHSDHLDQINNFLFKQLNTAGIEDWHAFRNQSGFFKNLSEKQIKKALVYWGMAEMKHPTLAKLATRLLKIPASSAQIERVFSSWGYVHSSMRNILTFERSKKLVHIYYSLRLEDGDNSDSD